MTKIFAYQMPLIVENNTCVYSIFLDVLMQYYVLALFHDKFIQHMLTYFALFIFIGSV